MADFSLTLDAERIIAGAGAGGRALREAITEVGVDRAASILADEVAFRCGLGRSMSDVLIELVIGGNTTLLKFSAGERTTVATPDAAPTVMRAEFDLVDLAAQLYGPRADRHATVGSTTLLAPVRDADPKTGMPDWALLDSASRACDQLLAATSAARPDLGALALDHESDKWGVLHRFGPHYDRHFAGLRQEAVRVLEIGIGGYGFRPGGGSLTMWKRYFPRGVVYGMDIFDKSHADECRIQTIIGDQNDPECLQRIAAEYGPFDVIIDDGSHVNEHVRTSFGELFRHVRPGGLYVIEDLWTAFAPGFGGTDAAESGAQTSLGLVKSLVDGLHYEESPKDGAGADVQVTGLHVYHNLAFIERGTNAEGGIPPWVPRSIGDLV